MANLKEIRTRIASVSSTKQITSAMKMVSASKLRKAQNIITQMRPYAEKLTEILQNLSNSVSAKEENIYAEKRNAEKILIVAISSNKGLCGAFNSNVFKEIKRIVNEKFPAQYQAGNVHILGIGKKAIDLIKRTDLNIISTYNEIYDDLSYNNVAPIATELMTLFKQKKYDKIELVYNQFKNAAVQYIVDENYLPLVANDEFNDAYPPDYILEPSKEEIVETLIPKSLSIQLYKAILDSNASEHGARMTAMHKATDNATELIKDLKLTYNKARQAAITTEILEIVGGAEALNS